MLPVVASINEFTVRYHKPYFCPIFIFVSDTQCYEIITMGIGSIFTNPDKVSLDDFIMDISGQIQVNPSMGYTEDLADYYSEYENQIKLENYDCVNKTMHQTIFDKFVVLEEE